MRPHVTINQNRWPFVGDSPNDVLMFEHFPHSIGVTNVRRLEAGRFWIGRYLADA